MMEEPPAINNMCTTDFQGWIDGEHPKANEGVVKRKVGEMFILERLGHDSPLEGSIEMLCLPLGCSNPGKGCRRNQSE